MAGTRRTATKSEPKRKARTQPKATVDMSALAMVAEQAATAALTGLPAPKVAPGPQGKAQSHQKAPTQAIQASTQAAKTGKAALPEPAADPAPQAAQGRKRAPSTRLLEAQESEALLVVKRAKKTDTSVPKASSVEPSSGAEGSGPELSSQGSADTNLMTKQDTTHSKKTTTPKPDTEMQASDTMTAEPAAAKPAAPIAAPAPSMPATGADAAAAQAPAAQVVATRSGRVSRPSMLAKQCKEATGALRRVKQGGVTKPESNKAAAHVATSSGTPVTQKSLGRRVSKGQAQVQGHDSAAVSSDAAGSGTQTPVPAPAAAPAAASPAPAAPSPSPAPPSPSNTTPHLSPQSSISKQFMPHTQLSQASAPVLPVPAAVPAPVPAPMPLHALMAYVHCMDIPSFPAPVSHRPQKPLSPGVSFRKTHVRKQCSVQRSGLDDNMDVSVGRRKYTNGAAGGKKHRRV